MFVAVAALNQAALFGALIVFAVMGLGSLFVVLKDVQDNLPQTGPLGSNDNQHQLPFR